MRKCYYTNDKQAGKILIPGCYPMLHSDDIKDCICNDFPETLYQFEKKEYNKILAEKNAYIKELENEIIKLKVTIYLLILNLYVKSVK